MSSGKNIAVAGRLVSHWWRRIVAQEQADLPDVVTGVPVEGRRLRSAR